MTAMRAGLALSASSFVMLMTALGPAAHELGGTKPTARDLTQSLFKADSRSPLDYSGANLALLDLSGLDFKHAKLVGADLFGVDLTDANLSGTDLSGARLDRTVIMRANFNGARLEGASILRPTIFSGLAFDRNEAPLFAKADLRRVRVTARLDGADFQGADLRGANFSPHELRGDISILPRNICDKCNFTGANLEGANLMFMRFTFATFAHANLRGANLSHADLSKVDLTGANLTGADLTDADLDGANLGSVIGLDAAQGLALALNLDRAIR